MLMVEMRDYIHSGSCCGNSRHFKMQDSGCQEILSLIAELEFELDVERILITCVESVLKS